MFPMREQLEQLQKRAANKGIQPSHKHIMENVKKIEEGIRDLEAQQRARFAREAGEAEDFFKDKGGVPENLRMAACFDRNYKPPFIR